MKLLGAAAADEWEVNPVVLASTNLPLSRLAIVQVGISALSDRLALALNRRYISHETKKRPQHTRCHMRLRILGGLELTAFNGVPFEGATRQTRLMLACLALAGVKGLKRAELCAIFWPDRPSSRARNSLRQGLAAIRKMLSSDDNAMSLQTDLEVARLVATPEALDVVAFRDALQTDNRDGWIAAARAYGAPYWRGSRRRRQSNNASPSIAEPLPSRPLRLPND
jgi:hypothetical protein